jgi:hypothetical protein
MAVKTIRLPVLARGHADRRSKDSSAKIAIMFDWDQVETIRQLALDADCSFAEQVRRLLNTALWLKGAA